MRKYIAPAALAFVLASGCGNTSQAWTRPSSAAALCSASNDFTESVKVSLEGIDYTHNDWSYIARVIDADGAWQAGVSYRRYKTALQGTGWSEPDAFASKAGAWSAGFKMFGDEWGNSIFQLGGKQTWNLGDRWMYSIGGSFDLLTNGSANTILSLETGLKYYLTDDLRLTGDWMWAQWANGGTFSYSYYNFGAEMLLGDDSPFLVGAEYEHEHINSGGGDADNLLVKAQWYGNKMMAGINGKMCRGMFNELYFYGFEVGFLAGPNGTIKAGFEQIAGPTVGNNLSNASISYEIRF